MTESREDAAAAGLSKLSIRTFRAFLRAIRSEEACLAVRLANERLDDGDTVQSLFFTGQEFGFHLAVKGEKPSFFRIDFGCQAGPLAGDGGTWDVVVDHDGEIVRTTSHGCWIS